MPSPWRPSGGGGNGEVKVTSLDSIANFLDNKIVGAGNITTAVLNPGANEQLEISDSGINGKNAYTTTAADFIMPAVGDQVVIETQPGEADWSQIGQAIYCENAGYLSVFSKPDSDHIEVTNTSISQNTPAGATVPAGSGVSPSGPAGVLNGTVTLLVRAMFDDALPSYTYDNGTGGIGASIESTVNAALPDADDIALNVGDRVFYGWSSTRTSPAIEAGIYIVESVGLAGGGGSHWRIVRDELADTAGELSGCAFNVANGTRYGGTSYFLPFSALVVGTTPLAWACTSGPFTEFAYSATVGEVDWVPYARRLLLPVGATGSGGSGGGGGGGGSRIGATSGGGGGGKDGGAGGPATLMVGQLVQVTPGEEFTEIRGAGGSAGSAGKGGAAGADGTSGTAGGPGGVTTIISKAGDYWLGAGRGSGPAGGSGGGAGIRGQTGAGTAGGAGGSGVVTAGTGWPDPQYVWQPVSAAVNGGAGGNGVGGLNGANGGVGTSIQAGTFYSASPMIAAPGQGLGGTGDGLTLGGGGGGSAGANGGGGWELPFGTFGVPTVISGKGGDGGRGGDFTTNAGALAGTDGQPGTHGRGAGSGGGGGGAGGAAAGLDGKDGGAGALGSDGATSKTWY